MANAVYDPETEGEQRYHPPNLDSVDNTPAGKTGDPRGDLRQAETSGGTGTTGGSVSAGGSGGSTSGGGSFNFNPKGDKKTKDKDASSVADGLAAAESAAGGVAAGFGTGTAANSFRVLAKNSKNFFWGSTKRKRTTAAGSITAIGVGGALVVGSLLSGPFEFVHIAQMLEQFHFAGQQDESNDRLGKLFRYARYAPKGDAYRTNLNYTGNRLADGVEAKLREQGLASSYSKFFGLKGGYVIDKNNPEFKGKTDDEIRQQLRDKFQNSDLKFSTITDEAGGTHLYMDQPSGYRDSLHINRTVLNEAGYGGRTSAIGARIMGARDGVDWSPLKKLDKKVLGLAEDALGKLSKKEVQDKIDQEYQKDRIKNIANGVPENPGVAVKPDDKPGADQQQKDQTAADAASTAAEAEATAQEGNTAGQAAHSGEDLDGAKLKSFNDHVSAKILGGVTGAAGVLCIARGIAIDAGETKQKQVELPLVRTGTRALSEGNGIKAYGTSGKNIDLNQLAVDSKQFYNETNKTSWSSAQSYQAEIGNPNYRNLPEKDKPDSTLTTIGSGTPLDFLVAGTPIADALDPICSTAGQVVQGVVGFLGGPVSFLGSTLVGAIVGPPIIEKISDYLAGQAVNLNPSGAQYGNYINYGARLAANDQALSSGGRALDGPEEGQLASVTNGDFKQQFEKRSLAYRIFNPTDRMSLVSSLMDRQSNSVPANVSNLAFATVNVGHSLTSTFSSIFSGFASAATRQTFDYGFPEIGFSIAEMDNPNTENPYTNGDAVANLLDNNGKNGTPDYISMVDKCFGDTIDQISVPGPKGGNNQVWDVKYGTDPVNIYTAEYKDMAGSCNGTSDPNWVMIRFFVFDTQNIKAANCYAGDDEACTEMGFADPAAANAALAPTGNGTLPTGSAQDLAQQLIPAVHSGKIQCVFSPGCPDIINTANGTSIKGGEGCLVDSLKPGLLGMLLGLTQEGHTFVLSALCSDHHNDGIELHAGGTSADFNTIDGVFMGPNEGEPWDSGKIAAGKKLDEDALALVGRDRLKFGQIQCHAIFSFQHEPPDFPDGCHHQHITVVN